MVSKKWFIFPVIVFLALLLSACSDVISTEQADGPRGYVRLSAGSSPTTKTYVESSESSMLVRWSAGDRMAVNGAEYKLLSGQGTSLGEFAVLEASAYRAVYPCSLANTPWSSGTSVEVTLPATQPYVRISEGGNIGDGTLPMIGYSTTSSLSLKHICGLVQLNIRGLGAIKTITAICDSEHNISGPGTITSATSASPVLTMNTSDATEVYNTITISTPSSGVAISDSEPFYIALPPGTYSSMVFELEPMSGSTIRRTVKNLTITAGEVRRATLTGIPSYNDYIGDDWKIWSLSNDSETAYVNVKIEANGENTLKMTTDPVAYAGGTSTSPTPTYSLVFENVKYIPSDGSLKIYPQIVASVTAVVDNTKSTYKGTTVAGADYWAVCSTQSPAGTNYTTMSESAFITGVWDGTDLNPTISFTGCVYGTGDSQRTVYRMAFLPYYPGETASTARLRGTELVLYSGNDIAIHLTKR